MTTKYIPIGAKKPKTARDTVLDVNFWSSAFNWFLICGAFAIAIGTVGSIRTQATKERFADERISANEAETEKAKASSARSLERVAELNNETERLKSDNLALAAIM